MNTQHTPGPWLLDGLTIKGPHPKDPQNRLRIVAQSVFDKGTWVDEARANARLIAAAPDLLEALRNIVSASLRYRLEESDPAVEEARAAIAKATGSKP
jgi:hypothetical protein